jgi:hypothetical protein
MAGLNFDAVAAAANDSVFEEAERHEQRALNEESLARAERIQARKNFFLTSAERKHAIAGQAALANHSQAVFEESALECPVVSSTSEEEEETLLHGVTSYRERRGNRSHVGGKGVLPGVDQCRYNISIRGGEARQYQVSGVP